MTTQSQLVEAIYSQVKALATSLGIPCGYPATAFKPPATGRWLELRIFPNDIDLTLSDTESYRRGFFQLVVYARPGTGSVPLMQVAESVAAAFPKGQTIAGSVIVSATPELRSLLEMDDKIALPVSINYAE